LSSIMIRDVEERERMTEDGEREVEVNIVG
jgi:hypothetical protein